MKPELVSGFYIFAFEVMVQVFYRPCLASLPPFFYACKYQGSLATGLQETDDVTLTVSIGGNPEFYVAQQVYEVTITSNQAFNGILVTGLYSSKNVQHKVHPLAFGMSNPGITQDELTTSDYVCGMLYSDIAPQAVPSTQITFEWTAPAAKTGCIRFLLTGSAGMQIIFQDVMAFQICEEGQIADQLRPDLADVHTNGMILRDDFDSEETVEIWSSSSVGVSFFNDCGEISHGNSAVFCGNSSKRELISLDLNLTASTVLQFTTGAGTCSSQNLTMGVSYELNGTWVIMKWITVNQHRDVHLVHIPQEAKLVNTSLKFFQNMSDGENGCFGLDNVLMVENKKNPTYLYENLDPIDEGKWLFMPGANIKPDCMSQENAMVFSSSLNDSGANFAVTRDLDLSEGSVSNRHSPELKAKNGETANAACGHTHANESIYVFNGNGKRKLCTELTGITENVVALKFHLSMGSGDCLYSRNSAAKIKLTGQIGSNKKTLSTFHPEGFKKVKHVIIPLPHILRRNGASLCLEQTGNHQENTNVWAVDSFQLVERPSQLEYYMQFTLNTLCSSAFTETEVKVQFSNDYGRRWHLLQRECLPETCQGRHWTHHSKFHSLYQQGWSRVNLPLPISALSEHVRFRWIQEGEPDIDSVWAIDNIYIGSNTLCPNMCNGHGACASTGCKCDSGWQGDSCAISLQNLPASLSIDFKSSENLEYAFEELYGGHVGYECGVIGNDKALVFNGEGRRYMITVPHNGSQIRYVQFSILMGRHSLTGSCRPPNKAGDGVLVQYTLNNGMTWHLLSLIPFNSERRVTIFSIPIPSAASHPGLQIRWLQPNDHLKGESVWAVDDILLSNELYKSIYSTPDDYQKIYTASVSFHTGMLTNYCNRSNVLLFSSDRFRQTLRYAETQTMETAEGVVLEADVNLQCGDDGEYDPYHEVRLEYSKDDGATWHLVQNEKLPGSIDEGNFHAASIYHVSEFKGWMTTVVPLPKATWSSNLRLRVVHNRQSTGVWALDNVYMGPACDMHCRGRGRCRNGQCLCNDDSFGSSCMSRTPLPTGISAKSEEIPALESKGWNIVGASSQLSDQATCGVMPARKFLNFHKPGVRKFETPDLDTRYGGAIQFYIQLNGNSCEAPVERSSGILLQYSNNGGVTWILLNELYYLDYTTPSYIHRDLPLEACTIQTRFQWWQPRNRGSGIDAWSIADVIVGDAVAATVEQSVGGTLKKGGQRRDADEYPPTTVKFMVLSNSGNPVEFCEPRFNSIVFNAVGGDRFTITDDFSLLPGDAIEFEINIGCSPDFSWESPVRLEYSHNEGYSWDLVQLACYPEGRPIWHFSKIRSPSDPMSAYDCTGAACELKEPSVYYKGLYSTWKRIIIPVTDRVASKRVRFRWWQYVPFNSTSAPATWAIRSVRIGKSCPSHCSGHGICVEGLDDEAVCQCNSGYGGVICPESDITLTYYYPTKSCNINLEPIAGFWEHFSEAPNPLWWKTVAGVVNGRGCGNAHDNSSLFFGGDGWRILETVSLNTRSIRMIQFYLQMGGKSSEDTCLVPDDRDESILLQYSNDNGISWNLVKELTFDAYKDGGVRVIVNIPFLAKTESTSFRWWQPLQESDQPRSQWSIDDVFIGGPDILRDGFADNFDSQVLSENYWYSVHWASIGQFKKENQSSDPHRHALVVTSAEGVAETWDFKLGSGSFIQFDLILGCGRKNPEGSFLKVEYSDDLGLTWQPVIPECPPASSGCDHDYGSYFYAAIHQDWTRRTIALPPKFSNLPHVRFRWTLHDCINGTEAWAIDNVYIGNGCPWMCNGYGRCWPDEDGVDSCWCDKDFDNTLDCHRAVKLSSEMEVTFDQPWHGENFAMVIGGESVLFNGNLVNGDNLEMRLAGMRILQTVALNTLDMKYLQFYLSVQGETESALVIQATRNGGITWSTLRLVYLSDLYDSKTLIHVELSQYARYETVSFRLWQTQLKTTTPNFQEDSDVWSVDNMLIGGKWSSCNEYLLEDNFTSVSSTWLHNDHVSRNYFCESSGTSVIVTPTLGEHSVTTKDLCVSENYVIQFKIAVGCGEDGSDQYPVRLEYSSDHGISWQLINEDCLGHDPIPRGCTVELHSSSVYYPGTTQGWRRVVIPLRNIACGNVRFRWNQGYFNDVTELSKSVRWALDDVYIGPSCEQACNGHGICANAGETCVCDSGYTGPTCCDIASPNPTFLLESFENDDGQGIERAMNQFSILAGGNLYKDTFSCGNNTGFQCVYKADGPGERILATRDLDLRNAESLQFYVTFKDVEWSPIDTLSDTASHMVDHLHVQYSTDGGIVWKLLESLQIIENIDHEMQYIALELPEEARANATRIRWWHPKIHAARSHWFSIDQIFVGGPSAAIDDSFEDVDYSTWVDLSGSQIQPNAGSDCCNDTKGFCEFLEVGGGSYDQRHCDQNYAATNGLRVTRGSYISFDLKMNCKQKEDNCEGIELQYSTDMGKSWNAVVPPCYPGTSSCTQLYPGSIFFSDVYSSTGNSRIVVPLPSHTWSPSTRFRWLQASEHPEAWFLDHVYIGNECPGACYGRGKCRQRTCVCDQGWSGTRCENMVSKLPEEIKEVFANDTWGRMSQKFAKIIGGEIDDVCGRVGFGHSLRFSKSCSRLLETVPMDTSRADFVQFSFRFGCAGSPPSQRNEGVLLDFTTNGGAVWHNLGEMYFNEHATKPSFINIALPSNAKTVGTQFRWWQPEHSRVKGEQDWAIDDLHIGGRREDAILSDDFNVKSNVGPSGLLLDRGHNHMWQFYDNTEQGSFCGRDDVILAGKTPGIDTSIVTKDFVPIVGFMIQYTIVVLCENVEKNHQPVHLQYSSDFGDTWHYLVDQCTTSDHECLDKELSQPSAHFISSNWRRKTIWIPESLHNKPVRFRFHQISSDVVWALDRVFVGPACPDACSGHGDCVGIVRDDLFNPGKSTKTQNCLCDFGYAQPNCYLDTEGNKQFLKDDFNSGGAIGNWNLIESRKMDTHCGIVFDGLSMSFSGVGPRQMETEDMDLQDATFVQYYAVIGRNTSGCLPATNRREGILMQYSTDAGISWHILRELDYSSYLTPTEDYVNLPLEARTNATRLRWWQPFDISATTGLVGMGEDRASWALDNILIGGNEVNDFSLTEDFETVAGLLNERKYDFYPNGRVGIGLCPSDNTNHMAWTGATPSYPKQSLTTRQLIVVPGHMMQFKIKVGCSEVPSCSADFPVKLQYREDPRLGDEWDLVKPECYPNSVPSSYCVPYIYHDSSTYKLEYQNVWKRVTIPLDYVSSDLTQFRWIQDDDAPELHSWAIDEIYIGESCPNYCSGHGRCSTSLECICDPGFTGEDCGTPWVRYLVPVFRDSFESERLESRLWSKLSGGNITTDGCGPFRSYGFAKNAYFFDCGERQLVSRELDLTKAWNIQYVLQFGSQAPNPDCRIYQDSSTDELTMATIVLQYTTNNGITWHTLREHWPGQYSIPRRVTQPLPTSAKQRTTIFRWWQPTHHGFGYDQWALDNVDISMTRRARHNHFLDYQRLLAQHRTQSSNAPQNDFAVLKSADRTRFGSRSYRGRGDAGRK